MQLVVTPAVLQWFSPYLDNTDSSYGNEDNNDDNTDSNHENEDNGNDDMLAGVGPA